MSNKNLIIVGSILILLAVGAGVGLSYYQNRDVDITDGGTTIDTDGMSSGGSSISDSVDKSVIDFESCAKSTGIVQESYPRKCVYNGTTYTEVIVEEQSDDEKKVDVVDDSTNTDSIKFETAKQTRGTSTEVIYTIDSLQKSDKNTYYSLLFQISSIGNTTDSPLVSAEYIASKNIIRVVFNGIQTDKTGLGYSQSGDINLNNITNISHTITGKSELHYFDVGVLNSSPYFYLSMVDDGSNKWNVELKIKYDSVVKDVGENLGTEQFGTNQVDIVGSTAADGVTLNGYSYIASGGVYKMIFSVNGPSSKPYPSVNAYNNTNGDLVVEFPSVASDVFGNTSKTLTSTGSIGPVEFVRSGQSSKYVFTNTNNNQFKIKASKAPASITLEIKL